MIFTHQQTSRDGFTVVEIVVAVFLIALSVTGLVTMMVSAQFAQRDTYYLSEASRVAQTKLEELTAKPFDQISNGTTNFSSDSSLSKLPGGKTGQVVVSNAPHLPDGKQIEVTITYPVGTQQKKVIMTAYVSPTE